MNEAEQIVPGDLARTFMKGLLLLAFAGCLTAPGCSVFLVTQQPSLKNLSVLEAGTTQAAVEAELGPSLWSQKHDLETVAVYQFVQGYSALMRGGRATFHVFADIASIGIWEIPGTLLEKYVLTGVPLTAKVIYDPDSKVRTAELFDPRQLPDIRDTINSGSLGIGITPDAPQELRTPGKGRLAGAGRGATIGAFVGSMAAAPVLWAPPLAVFAGVGGAVIGSITGAAYGAVATEPAEEPEAILKTTLQDLTLLESLRDHVSRKIHKRFSIAASPLGAEEVDAAHVARSHPSFQVKGSYPGFDDRGMKTILELSPLGIELRNYDWLSQPTINPKKELIIAVWVRLIRTVDGLQLGYWSVTDEDSVPLHLHEWAADNGRPFREALSSATRRLADRVVREIFSLGSPLSDPPEEETENVTMRFAGPLESPA
jgi:hypothetical protein